MPRQKKKYNERLNLGCAADGSYIRPWIRADSKQEFEELKKKAVKDAAMIRNLSGVRFGEYADKWYKIYKSHKSQQTQDMYSNILKKFECIKLMPLRDVTSSDLQGIINENFEHPRICSLIKLTLKQIYKQAIKDGLVYPVNLAEDLEIPKANQEEMRFITDKEMKLVLKCDFEPQDKLYVEMLRNTGMRPSEALAIQWNDIDTENKVIHIRRSFEFKNNQPKVKTTKTHKNRDIPINTSFAQMLSDASKPGLFVFLWNGGPFTKSAYVAMSKRIFAKINAAFGGNEKMDVLNGLVMYSFRHTYATQVLYYQGVKPRLISTKQAAKIMGHSERVFIERYTHLDESKEKISKLVEKITAVS